MILITIYATIVATSIPHQQDINTNRIGQSAPTANFTEFALNLDPPLPNFINFNKSPTQRRLVSFRMTSGDLNGDDIPDLIFSNNLAFLRIYFMKEVGGRPKVDSHYDVLPYGTYDAQNNDFIAPTCSTTGADARFTTTVTGGFDTTLVADIDADGLNELIYFEHIVIGGTPGSVGLQVYDAVNSGGSWQMAPQAHNEVNVGGHMNNLYGWYFLVGGDCSQGQTNNESFNIAIANFRGRATPQDIVLWASNPYNARAVEVFAYDSNGSNAPTVNSLFEHQTSTYVPGQGVEAMWGGAGPHVEASRHRL